MIIKGLTLENWNQFEEVDISFHPKLTVITGANGAGKSTILRLLSTFIGWKYTEVATPYLENREIRYKAIRKRKVNTDYQNASRIGNITLGDGQAAGLFVPNDLQVNYGVFSEYHLNLSGINILSHRTPYSYQKVTSIPVKPQTRREAFSSFDQLIKLLALRDGYIDPNSTPTLKMKSSIMSLAIFGRGNEFIQPNEEALKLFLGFNDILHKLLPPTLGFETITIRDGEVILVTKSGDFLLDAVSGGIGAVLDLAWQIYMYNENDEPFLVLIDEAENHLHASMQRTLLPNLINSFPSAQFIITTHSPLMVNSVKDSSVYVLKYNDDNLVESSILDFENKAGNAAEILRDVLGVPITMPIWVEDSLKTILEKYRSSDLTPESYLGLKQDLAELGLADHLPQALGMLQGG